MIRNHIACCALLAALVTPGAHAQDTPPATDPSLQAFLPRFEEGTRRFMNGDARLWKENASHADDAMIMGAWGAWEKGWPAVSDRYDWAVARFRDSQASLDVDYLSTFESGDLAVTVAVERATVRLAGQSEVRPMALRVTHVFRREDGEWKLVLRHADPLVGKTAAETVLER
jgi:ketosteroid isomerase-like protein